MWKDTDVLLVIDVQNDFCPGGKLAVPGGNEVVPLINRLAHSFRHAVLTQDWHPANHASFAANHPGAAPFSLTEMPYGPQVLWPTHCVQGTDGAAFHAALRTDPAQLIILPETAIPAFFDQLPMHYIEALKAAAQRHGGDIILGTLTGGGERYFNSAISLGQSPLQVYSKSHLVPFGEFIPPFFRWFIDLMVIPLGDFNRGALPQPTFDWQGQRLAATICYENLFSEELASQFLMDAKAPTILVNVSNLGWFGEHLAMDQHLHIARMRSLEFDRPFLLATNTGLTAFVDNRARVTSVAASHQATALHSVVEGRTGITPYAWWVARWSQWPMMFMGLGLLLSAWFRRPGKASRSRGLSP